MKPSIFNYCLAHTFCLSAGGGALAACILLTKMYLDEDVFLLSAGYLIIVLLTYIPVALLGFFFGVFPAGVAAIRIASKFQGAPFQRGDTVCVLSGKYDYYNL